MKILSGKLFLFFMALMLWGLIIIAANEVIAGADDGLPKQEIVEKEITLERAKMSCIVTPTIPTDNIPLKIINKSNNLVRKPGAARKAMGQYIKIAGKIVDEDCLPISNAVIQIWQADNAGKYLDEYDLKTEWNVQDKRYDKHFRYSGTAQTNNLGEYGFITILPGLTDDTSAPHINLNIRHSDFAELSTRIFFNKHPRNAKDFYLNKVESGKKTLVTAQGHKLDQQNRFEGRVYDLDVTLEGINKYRQY